MKIAVSYEEKDGSVFFHVGDTKIYKVFEVEEKQIIHSELVSVTGKGRNAVLDFAKTNEIQVLICGNICDGAKQACEEMGLLVYGCVKGDADLAVANYLQGELTDQGTVACTHDE